MVKPMCVFSEGEEGVIKVPQNRKKKKIMNFSDRWRLKILLHDNRLYFSAKNNF